MDEYSLDSLNIERPLFEVTDQELVREFFQRYPAAVVMWIDVDGGDDNQTESLRMMRSGGYYINIGMVEKAKRMLVTEEEYDPD